MTERHTLLFLSLCFAGCDVEESVGKNDSPQGAAEAALAADPRFSMDPETHRIAVDRTRLRIAPKVLLTEDAEREAWELRYRLARSLQRASPAAADLEPVTVEYLGIGNTQPLAVDEVDVVDEPMPEVPAALLDGAIWLDGFSEVTGNEFRIRIPRALGREISDMGIRHGVHLGSGDPGEDDVTPRGLSDGEDSRVMYGQIDTAHTEPRYRRMVQINGGCSGTLIGPKHTITAAHCVWQWDGPNIGHWGTGTLRAGRNGTQWLADASISSQRWYWVPSQYRAAASAPGTSGWDIGMFITHGSRMGEDPDVNGWFGFWWYHTAEGFERYTKSNRGYPVCNSSISPPMCSASHLYGDTNDCQVGDYGKVSDSAGIPLSLKHSCDTSAGMSGSSLYEYNEAAKAWVVTGVHTGRDGNGGPLTNYATRLTRDYSETLVTLLETFP